MRKQAPVKVPMFQTARPVVLESRANEGAIVGRDLWLPDGTLVTAEMIVNQAPTDDYPHTFWRLIQEIPPNVVALAETTTTGLYAITGDGESATRTIQPVAGETTVTDGDGVDDDPAIGLADVDPVAGGTLQLTQFDAKGRRSHEDEATTDDLPEGSTNLYFTAARVRATILTGLSTATAAVIDATDTVLSAFGKLQAQISAIVTSLAGYVDTTTDQDIGGVKTFTGNGPVFRGLGTGIEGAFPALQFRTETSVRRWRFRYAANDAGDGPFNVDKWNGISWDTILAVNTAATELSLLGNAVWHAGNLTPDSGTYTPTPTGVANVSSVTANASTYMRVNNSVVLSGRINVTPTAAGVFTTVDFDIPIASNFSGNLDANGDGTFVQFSTGSMGGASLNSIAANTLRISLYPVNTAVHQVRYSIVYPILP